MPSCSQCGAALETPLGCEACGALFQTEALTPYEIFGLAPGTSPDARELKRRLLRFSRLTHPDFHGNGPEEERARAERNTALLNEAHEILSDDFARADWIIRHLGGPAESDERQMPTAFLMEVLEWNETLEEARNEPADAPLPAALGVLETTWNNERRTNLDAVLARLDPLPRNGASALTEARRQLNAVRYLDRALRELEALRLARAAG